MQLSLPYSVVQQAPAPLVPVGSGAFRKLGFTIYHATLWAPQGNYDPAKPYALSLRYDREVSKETLVENVMDDIRAQAAADEATLQKWEGILNSTLSPVKDGDVMVGLYVPGKKSRLFLNGKEVANIDDPAFSSAFFNIWLGDTADEGLRNKLLANAQ